MLGAIIGDIIGSVYEKASLKTTEFELFTEDSCFTDDTVLTIASADCLLNRGNYSLYYQKYGKKYPVAGYGGTFKNWMYSTDPQPYNSWGNGSAMRISPVAYVFDNLEDTLTEAEKSASVTHNHPEGIKGAQAVAAAIFLAKNGKTKTEIKEYVSNQFAYNLERKIIDIRPAYKFDVSCQGSVPEAIIAFLESSDFESSIRLAISLGGDADTQAAIAGSISVAFYKEIPENLIVESKNRLPKEFLDVIDRFYSKYS